MIEYLDRPVPGWFALAVMRREKRKWDWAALMIDMHPNEYRAGGFLTARQVWVRVPGKHRSHDAASEALEAIMATRH
jgi:hypothetical protein